MKTIPKIGSIVQLRSGGPMMTVEEVTEDLTLIESVPRVLVTWFDARDRAHSDTFELTALRGWKAVR